MIAYFKDFLQSDLTSTFKLSSLDMAPLPRHFRGYTSTPQGEGSFLPPMMLVNALSRQLVCLAISVVYNMSVKRKTWTEKLHDSDLLKIVKIDVKITGRWGEGMTIIPAQI